MGIGDWGLGPIPNPQSPLYCILISKFFINKNFYIIKIIKLINKILLIIYLSFFDNLN